MRRILCLMGIVLCLQGIGCATRSAHDGASVDTSVSRIAGLVDKGEPIALTELCGHYQIPWTKNYLNHSVSLTLPNYASAKLMVNSRFVLVGQEWVVLNAPVTVSRGQILTPSDFVAKVIERDRPVTAPAKMSFIKRPLSIMIDAGHGGKDPGALGITGIKEKDVVLDIAKELTALLRQRGLVVYMTRETDEFIPLARRSEMAVERGVDLFVSVHANSSPSKKVQGVEVFSLRPLGEQERYDEQRLRNEQAFLKKLAIDETDDARAIVLDLLYDAKLYASDKLAIDTANILAQDLSASNRGLKSAHFSVLRNTVIPAILVEVGFLTNKKEETNLNTSLYRKKVAASLADVIMNYVQSR